MSNGDSPTPGEIACDRVSDLEKRVETLEKRIRLMEPKEPLDPESSERLLIASRGVIDSHMSSREELDTAVVSHLALHRLIAIVEVCESSR